LIAFRAALFQRRRGLRIGREARITTTTSNALAR
jgi:hypothetical protein